MTTLLVSLGISWVNFLLNHVGFKHFKIGKWFYGRFLAKMTTVVPIPMSMSLCHVALKFFFQERWNLSLHPLKKNKKPFYFVLECS